METQNHTYATVPTQFVTAANGIKFAYRRYGLKKDVPVIYFNHLTANLDNCDPRVMDGIAMQREIISFDYRGVGGTSGEHAKSIYDMAKDSLGFIKALGFDKIDILSFSLGGFVSQELLELDPNLVRKIILSGTGTRGGMTVPGNLKRSMWDMGKETFIDMIKAALTFKDAKYYLFFTSSKDSKNSARLFLKRLKERRINRDVPVKFKILKTQVTIIYNWQYDPPANLSKFTLPVLIVNGDSDKMVPSSNSYDMAKRFPNAQLHIYEESGHGSIFQHHFDFIKRALAFYAE